MTSNDLEKEIELKNQAISKFSRIGKQAHSGIFSSQRTGALQQKRAFISQFSF